MKSKNTSKKSQSGTHQKEVIKILEDIGAIITNDHFVYTSGKHGSVYVRKDKLYPNTKLTSKITLFMAQDTQKLPIEAVVGPSMGGVILSHLLASHLTKIKKKDVLGVFTEKEEGEQVFKRGYDSLIKGKNVLVVEDLTTTGGSVKDVVDKTKKAGGKVVGVYVLLNRNPDGVSKKMMGAPFYALSVLKADAFDEKDCPLCKMKRPINTEVGHGKTYLKTHKK